MDSIKQEVRSHSSQQNDCEDEEDVVVRSDEELNDEEEDPNNQVAEFDDNPAVEGKVDLHEYHKLHLMSKAAQERIFKRKRSMHKIIQKSVLTAGCKLPESVDGEHFFEAKEVASKASWTDEFIKHVYRTYQEQLGKPATEREVTGFPGHCRTKREINGEKTKRVKYSKTRSNRLYM